MQNGIRMPNAKNRMVNWLYDVFVFKSIIIQEHANYNLLHIQVLSSINNNFHLHVHLHTRTYTLLTQI